MADILFRDINFEYRGRQRNRHFIEAHELTKVWHSLREWQIDLFGQGDRFFPRRVISDSIVGHARSYKIETKDSTIWLWGESVKGRFFYFIPYYHRFRKEYVREQIIKLNHAFRELRISGSMIFITLTIDPSLFYSIWEGYKESQRYANRLLTYLRKNLNLFLNGIRNKKGSLFRYVRVAEIQERNTKNIHFHIAMSIRDINEDWEDWNERYFNKIRDIVKSEWKIGFSDIKLVRENKKHGLRNYMLKYLEKSLRMDEDINENNAILWALNARIFSFSNIEKWKKENDLITAESGKNNSNWAMEADNEIIWEYAGVLKSIDIGHREGLYHESELTIEILEILYKIRFAKPAKKVNDNG